MQLLLTNFFYFVVAIYTLAMVYNTFCLLSNNQESETDEHSSIESFQVATPIATESPQVETLITTLKTTKYLDPATKDIEQVTVAQMKQYITDRQIQEQIETIISKKLYKARKLEIYNGLKAI